MIRRPRFRDLPVAGKLLLPYLALMLIVGAAGTFTVVRSLTDRAENTLHQQLGRNLLDARAAVRDQELYALESANFAANLRDIPEQVEVRDSDAVARLLGSVLALKKDLDLLVVTDTRGVGIGEYVRNGDRLTSGLGTRWTTQQFVGQALGSTTGSATAGLLAVGDRTFLAVAAPVCSRAESCRPVGVALAGVDARDVAALAADRGGDVALYDAAGTRLAASADDVPVPTRDQLRDERLVVVRSDVEGTEMATMIAPLDVQRQVVGTLTTSLSAAPVFGSVRGAAYRLAVLVLIAMLGIVAIGALLSRTILRQVRPLVATHRALGAGDLDARATVHGDDELGEVAVGLNRMAEQLQASVTALESQVDQRTAEVRRLLAQRTEFFAGLTHEFRTPLAVILAQAQLLLDSMGRRSRADRSSLEAVQQSAREALALVNQYLELARAEADRRDVLLQPVDLGALLRGLAPTVQGLAAGANVRGVVEAPVTLPHVVGDPARLREIVLNLVDNAVKYTPRGGEVSVSAVADGGAVVLEVSDTGLGIPQEVGEHVFDPFYRVAGNSTQAGQPSTGLGLALTRQLVHAHGGTISYTSEVGSGTSFQVTLPAALAATDGERVSGGRSAEPAQRRIVDAAVSAV